jgi:hypothetical protein
MVSFCEKQKQVRNVAAASENVEPSVASRIFMAASLR